MSPKGPSEGEPDWLSRVLRSLSPSPDWGAIVAGQVPTGTDPIDALINLVYRQARLPSFHAKHGHSVLLPADQAAMKLAGQASALAERLIKELASHVGYRLSDSYVFPAGFKKLIAPLLEAATIQFSADPRPHNPADEQFTDGAHPATVLRPETSTLHDFRLTWSTTVPSPNAPVARVGIVLPEYPLSATCYETILDPTGFATMEIVVGLHMVQHGP